jgi:predicted RNase H-like HicB family nuclease
MSTLVAYIVRPSKKKGGIGSTTLTASPIFVSPIFIRRTALGDGMGPYKITAEWDGEAQVWVASSEDVPGLATGADTFEELIEKLKIVIPELLIENGLLPPTTEQVPFAVRAERTELASVD